jgi:hypothetical protein
LLSSEKVAYLFWDFYPLKELTNTFDESDRDSIKNPASGNDKMIYHSLRLDFYFLIIFLEELGQLTTIEGWVYIGTTEMAGSGNYNQLLWGFTHIVVIYGVTWIYICVL